MALMHIYIIIIYHSYFMLFFSAFFNVFLCISTLDASVLCILLNYLSLIIMHYYTQFMSLLYFTSEFNLRKIEIKLYLFTSDVTVIPVTDWLVRVCVFTGWVKSILHFLGMGYHIGQMGRFLQIFFYICTFCEKYKVDIFTI